MSAAPTDSKGTYVAQVDIFEGRVAVTMGNRVHADVFDDIIYFTPYLTPSGGIVWRCGAAAAPAGATPLEGGGVISEHLDPTIETRYLPSTCRN